MRPAKAWQALIPGPAPRLTDNRNPQSYLAELEQGLQSSLILHKFLLYVGIKGEVSQAFHGPAPSARVNLVIA